MVLKTQAAASATLLNMCQTAVSRASELRRPVAVSFSAACGAMDPVDLFASASSAACRIFWSQPAAAFTLVGVGAAAQLCATGSHRFASIKTELQRLSDSAVIGGDSSEPTEKLTLLGGFGFRAEPAKSEWRSFPAGMLVLPRLLATFRGEQVCLTVNQICPPDTDAQTIAAQMQSVVATFSRYSPPVSERDKSTICDAPTSAALKVWENAGFTTEQLLQQPDVPEEWRESVAATIAHIRSGALEKAVLARAVRVQTPHQLDPAAILRFLTHAYPNCYIFAVDRGDGCFLGATPEQLVSVQDGTVHAMCLAGSRPRGSTPTADAALAQELLTSAKERGEHDIVVRALTDNLRQVCTDVVAPAAPGLLRLPNVQHLHTPVTAHLPHDRSVLDVAEQLHPTPAVGGYPRSAALQEIAAREQVARGWYAGPVGWADSLGNGEFSVAIRSALVKGTSAILYAGCGIVADSDPEQEYAESCLKLRPMLSALEACSR